MLVRETFEKKVGGKKQYENFEVNLEIRKEWIESEFYGKNSQTNIYQSIL